MFFRDFRGLLFTHVSQRLKLRQAEPDLLVAADQDVVEFLFESLSRGLGFGQADDHVDANFAGVDQGDVDICVGQ